MKTFTYIHRRDAEVAEVAQRTCWERRHPACIKRGLPKLPSNVRFLCAVAPAREPDRLQKEVSRKDAETQSLAKEKEDPPLLRDLSICKVTA